jgi:hypothetical protein
MLSGKCNHVLAKRYILSIMYDLKKEGVPATNAQIRKRLIAMDNQRAELNNRQVTANLKRLIIDGKIRKAGVVKEQYSYNKADAVLYELIQ